MISKPAANVAYTGSVGSIPASFAYAAEKTAPSSEKNPPPTRA